MFGNAESRAARKTEKQITSSLLSKMYDAAPLDIIRRNRIILDPNWALGGTMADSQYLHVLSMNKPEDPAIYKYAIVQWREKYGRGITDEYLKLNGPGVEDQLKLAAIEANRGNFQEVAALFVSFGKDKDRSASMREKGTLLAKAYANAADDAEMDQESAMIIDYYRQQQDEIMALVNTLPEQAAQSLRR